MNLFLGSDRRPVHFVGIAGAGMSALAQVALKRGMTVTGSDRAPEGAPDLPGLGARVWAGHDPAYVDGARAVVASAAIPEDHPELHRARELGLPVIRRKEALGQLVAGREVVALAGTHGKTTTTVMTTHALLGAGFDPTTLAGGRVATWGGNARIGGDELFVVEADEFDQAFLALHPVIAVVNNLEPEHLECYQGSAQVQEDAFVTFASRARRALIGSDDAGADAVARRVSVPVWRFGNTGPDLTLGKVGTTDRGAQAELTLAGGERVTLDLAVPGIHNLRNAAAAVGVVVALGGDPVRAAEGLRGFVGVGRRFERRGTSAGVTVVDDYAHHPTEVAVTLAATREAFPGRRVVAVFQPHLYSRTAALGEQMGRSLAGADVVFVTEVYAAREAPIPGVTGRLVAEAAERAGAAVAFVEGREPLLGQVLAALTEGDVVLTLGAGDITTLGPALLDRLAAR